MAAAILLEREYLVQGPWQVGSRSRSRGWAKDWAQDIGRDGAFGQQRRAFGDIAQFADIARP